jgi:hypothetical protein
MRTMQHGAVLMCLSITACVPMVSHDYDVKGRGDKSESGGGSPQPKSC